jgi:hypothetical protein
VPRPRHLCMESGTLSEWLYEELTPLVDKLVVVMSDRNSSSRRAPAGRACTRSATAWTHEQPTVLALTMPQFGQ